VDQPAQGRSRGAGRGGGRPAVRGWARAECQPDFPPERGVGVPPRGGYSLRLAASICHGDQRRGRGPRRHRTRSSSTFRITPTAAPAPPRRALRRPGPDRQSQASRVMAAARTGGRPRTSRHRPPRSRARPPRTLQALMDLAGLRAARSTALRSIGPPTPRRSPGRFVQDAACPRVDEECCWSALLHAHRSFAVQPGATTGPIATTRIATLASALHAPALSAAAQHVSARRGFAKRRPARRCNAKRGNAQHPAAAGRAGPRAVDAARWRVRASARRGASSRVSVKDA
jgi:hypothetical protein